MAVFISKNPIKNGFQATRSYQWSARWINTNKVEYVDKSKEMAVLAILRMGFKLLNHTCYQQDGALQKRALLKYSIAAGLIII